jgi:hypothetical protein
MGPFEDFGPTRLRSLVEKCSLRDCRNHKNTLLVTGARLSSHLGPTNRDSMQKFSRGGARHVGTYLGSLVALIFV